MVCVHLNYVSNLMGAGLHLFMKKCIKIYCGLIWNIGKVKIT